MLQNEFKATTDHGINNKLGQLDGMPVKRNNTQILTQPMASEVREDEDLLVLVAEESAEISWRAFPECREGAHWQRQQAARLTVTATHYCTVHTAHWPSPQSKHCQQSRLKQLSSSGYPA